MSPFDSALPTYPVTLLASYTLSVYIGNVIRTSKLDRDAVVLATSSACHILGGAIITAVAMINFPQAVVLGLGLSVLLAISRPRPAMAGPPDRFDRKSADGCSGGRSAIKFIRLFTLQLFTPEGVGLISRAIGASSVVEMGWRSLVRQWTLLGNWFVPGFLGVWWVLQLVACTLLWL
jgi:hypothetical protein